MSGGGLYGHNFSPARVASPQIRNTPSDFDSQYLAELLAEHQKFGPLIQSLPICGRLLNQEIIRVSALVSNSGFGDFERLHHRSPSPMASSNLMSSVGGSSLSGWNGLLQERLGGPQGIAMDWQVAPASPSSYIMKKILRLEIPVDNYPNFNFVGRLLGPRGNSLKRVEASTGCRVYIRGKGSIKDPGKAQSTTRAQQRSLDATLQDYAYKAFVRPRTGKEFKANVPYNLNGMKLSAMRLKSGSLFTRGVTKYNQFQIPVGVIEEPYVQRLVLVYQNLGDWSSVYYPLPGYTYLAPVLGLLAYDAFNLSATNLPTLDIRANGKPILVNFSDAKRVPRGLNAKCVWFDLHNGLPEFSNVSSGNICSTVQQGHFSIVVEYQPVAPSPAPEMATQPPPQGKKKDKWKVWKIVGIVIGGFILLLLLGLLIIGGKRYKSKKKMKQMEKASDVGEALKMTSVGNARAPVAMVTRTQPVLENEYVP